MICCECPCCNRITLECGVLRDDVSTDYLQGKSPENCPLRKKGGGEE